MSNSVIFVAVVLMLIILVRIFDKRVNDLEDRVQFLEKELLDTNVHTQRVIDLCGEVLNDNKKLNNHVRRCIETTEKTNALNAEMLHFNRHLVQALKEEESYDFFDEPDGEFADDLTGTD